MKKDEHLGKDVLQEKYIYPPGLPREMPSTQKPTSSQSGPLLQSKQLSSTISIFLTMSNILTLAGLACLVAHGALAASLGAYNVDPNSVSVSGMSAGGFMAAQLGVAYSSTFKTGFGVFAGGPYDCARNQLVRPLTYT
jgi:hypothetical protein